MVFPNFQEYGGSRGWGWGWGRGEGGNVPGRSCTALRPIWTIKPGQIFGGGGGSGLALPFSFILPEILFFKIPSLEAWVILG